MNANLMTKKIEMNKTEAVAAGKVGSEAFEELKELRAAYPDFEISVRKTKSKDNMKGLTVSYMEKYIQKHDTEDKRVMKEFYILCGKDEDGNKVELAPVVSYGELKMWFLEQYPEVEKLSADVSEIIQRAKQSRAAKRQAA